MTHEKIDLYDYFSLPRKGANGGFLTVFAHENNPEQKPKLRPAMLVIPGGGYYAVSARENEPVMTRYFNAGHTTFALSYTCNAPFPTPLIEGGMAMAYIRENAEKYYIDPQNVAAVGFSAGGHLAGMLGNMFDDEALVSTLGEKQKLVRPDAIILSYAVFTTLGEYTHGHSSEIISGGNNALKSKLSLETRVQKESSPAFIWHTVEDDAVPVENALIAASAYRKHKVPFELHVFEKGWHGLSVLSEETFDKEPPEKVMRNIAWVELSISWLKARGFVVKEK